MKKILLIIPAMLFTFGAFAQGPEFGIKAGMNLANEISDEGSTDSRVGFQGGFFAEFRLSRRLSLQPELMYSMQGAYTHKKNSPVGTAYTDKLDYINLPILLKIYVWDRRLSVDVGPQFGYMIGAKYAPKDGSTVDVYDDIDNKFDAGIKFGASFKFGQRWQVFTHYNIGFIEFIEGAGVLNAVFNMGMGFSF